MSKTSGSFSPKVRCFLTAKSIGCFKHAFASRIPYSPHSLPYCLFSTSFPTPSSMLALVCCSTQLVQLLLSPCLSHDEVFQPHGSSLTLSPELLNPCAAASCVPFAWMSSGITHWKHAAGWTPDFLFMFVSCSLSQLSKGHAIFLAMPVRNCLPQWFLSSHDHSPLVTHSQPASSVDSGIIEQSESDLPSPSFF